MPFSRVSFQPRDGTWASYISCIGRWVFVLFCFVLFLPPVPPGKLYGPTRKNTLIFSPTARSLPVTPTGNWWWRMGVSLPGSEQRMNQKCKERGTRSYTFPCNNQLPVYLLRHSVVSRFLWPNHIPLPGWLSPSPTLLLPLLLCEWCSLCLKCFFFHSSPFLYGELPYIFKS